MATLTPAATATEKIWLVFFSAPEFRQYNLIANQAILEAELEKYALSMSVQNLKTVFIEAEPSLARIQPRVQTQAPPVATPAPVEVEVEGVLPTALTRKYLIDCDKTEFYAIKKKYGTVAIEARLNGIN